MSFLKKLGSFALKIVGIWSGFAPYIVPAIPAGSTAGKIVDKLDQGFNEIVKVEQIFAAVSGGASGKGSDKLKAATPFVAQLIQQTELLAGKHPKDEVLFEDACTRATAAFADILNSYGD